MRSAHGFTRRVSRVLAQERLASEVEGLSLSASGGSATAAAAAAGIAGEPQAGGDAEGEQEAPLDSLLASAAEVGVGGKSNAHQVGAVVAPACAFVFL